MSRDELRDKARAERWQAARLRDASEAGIRFRAKMAEQRAERAELAESELRAQVATLQAQLAETQAETAAQIRAHQAKQRYETVLAERVRNLARPRFAFLVGIGKTDRRGNELPNPTNDVEDVGKKLTSLGFHCMTLIDEIATMSNVKANFKQFVECISKADSKIMDENAKPDLSLALFYFSGHGGTDASRSQTLVCYDGELHLNDILSQLAKRQVRKGADQKEHMPANFVLLDCCRKDAREKSDMQLIKEVYNTCILFSCRSSQKSSDGVPGRNGLFTSHLLWNLTTGLELPHHELIHNIKAGVARESGRRQVPLEKNCICEVAPIVLVENPSHLKSREYIEVAELLDTRSIWEHFAGLWAQTAKRLWDQAKRMMPSGFSAVRSAISRLVNTEEQGMRENGQGR